MTDFDTPRLDTPATDLSAFDAALADAVARETPLDTPDISGPDSWEAGQHALWRLISLAVVVATAVLVLFAVLDARRAGDIPAAEGVGALDLDTTNVTIGALGDIEAERIVPLGLGAGLFDATIGPDGATVRVPATKPSLIGAVDASGSLVGLALVASDADRTAVEVSTDSTARALLTLTPALLQPDMGLLSAQIDVIVADQAFANLVAALDADPVLSRENLGVETALAEILDRIPTRTPFPDQGCDSVADPQAYATAGACVEPGTDGVTITNEQDRWAVVFSVTEGQACGALGPADTPLNQVRLDAEDCAGDAILTAPGPIVDRALSERDIVAHVRSAAAVQLFASYVLPYADLAGGAAGSIVTPSSFVTDDIAAIVASLDELSATDADFAAAVDTLVTASSPIERHSGGIAAARTILSSANGPIADRPALSPTQTEIIEFLNRVGDRMLDATVSWRWTADSSGEIDLTGLDS